MIHLQPVSEDATDSNSEPLTRRSLGIAKDSYETRTVRLSHT